MFNEPEAVLESVVQMTGQRQLDSLAESLVSTVRQMVNAKQVEILKVDTDLALDEAVTQLVLQSNETAHNVLLECLKRRSTVKFASNKLEQAATPIMLKDVVVMILWVTCEHISNQDEQMLKGFSKVYENFLSIVIESETDPLTGLLNRKAFLPRLTKAAKVIKQEAIDCVINPQTCDLSAKRYWLCIFDIDKFKVINDTFGHLYGDEILIDLVRVMKSTFSELDSMFRFGGDEFVIIMSKREKAEMLNLCEDFSHKLSIHHGREVKVTISMGIIEINCQEEPSELLVKADKALYYIKETGRDRIGLYEDLIADGSIIPLKIEDDIELF
ncbi:GGDEF domain-containing protein [Shewanella sp. D64]|uniref:GGDEF domain-containing protein n=1 Tax=unclassified Shewanella TaxID=196818 RepID=UPI0022BA3CD9|nr:MULTISPECIES: GGDEF domain-containing protein [unclassified Shewanella]MEC4728556.1 GGDEF domain-containing protein [Shewanella sp. D64]MEC4740560.1 GGDEF domain-containing protein [Shewanella sp. E94]WBJ94247.1 GGDEF domain-containing protein [Shewanella sp. MTB7]